MTDNLGADIVSVVGMLYTMAWRHTNKLWIIKSPEFIRGFNF